MPRWRRPSLNEARKADPGTSLAAIEAERLTFARAAVAGDPGNERRRIRYRMVRLADSPDEILGQEIGRLDEGDEVELLERSGLYWKVRTPLGEIGWVHKMTLGDVVTAGTAAMDDDDDDSDVLAAFNEAQAMRAVQAQRAGPRRGSGRPVHPRARRQLTLRPGRLTSRAVERAWSLRAGGAPRCAGGRCWARRLGDSRTAAAACPPGTR